MAIIFGFNLSDMRWNAFAHRHMFDRRWNLRRERFIIYQIAMLVGLAAECTATYSLSKYSRQRHRIEAGTSFTATVHSEDIINAATVTIVFCVLVATLFGADFFFLVFWPRRVYPAWYNVSKLVLAVVISLGMLGTSIYSTIIVISRTSSITGVSPGMAQRWINTYPRPSLVYRHFPQNIAWIVLLWIATVATFASTVIMYIAYRHDEEFGTEPYSSDGLIDDDPSFTNGEKSTKTARRGRARA